MLCFIIGSNVECTHFDTSCIYSYCVANSYPIASVCFCTCVYEVCMKCAYSSLYPHMLSLPMKPSISAPLLSKQSELTTPVQQEERTYEVLHCVYVINPQRTCARVILVILSVCVSTSFLT